MTLQLDNFEKFFLQAKASKENNNNKITVEINEIGSRNTIEKIDNSKCWFFEKNQQFDKPLAGLKRKRERAYANK